MTTDRYDVVFIGAGLGSLSAGAMLAAKGRKVLVLERHNVPGGYATNFHRKDFAFDVSLHSLDGMTPDGPSFNMMRACGVQDDVEFIPHRTLYRYRSADIEFEVKHRDFEGYKATLSRLFPREKANIARMLAECERCYEQLAGFLYSPRRFTTRLVLTPLLYRAILKYEGVTVDQFFSRYVSDERLKAVLAAQWSYFGLPPKRLAFTYFNYAFIDYLKYGGYSIRGGSQQLSNALVARIERHGGRVVLSSPVTKVLRAGKAVCGVETRKLGRVEAPHVVSNISPSAVSRMLGRGALPNKFHRGLGRAKKSISGFQVYLGLSCRLEELGLDPSEYITFYAPTNDQEEQYELLEQGRLEEQKTGWSINLFSNVDPSMVAAGKSSLGIFTLLGASDWHLLPKAEYRLRKRELVDTLVRRAEEKIPGLSRHIEVIEAGSPRTLTKFTENDAGALYGFAQVPEQSGLFHRFPQRYPLRGLYQVGAWTFPGGGFAGAILSGKMLVERYF